MGFTEELKRFAERCVVHIPKADRIEGGTGFFVARDLVLTCAHVVSSTTPTPGGARINLCWGDLALTGTLVDARPWPADLGRNKIVPGPDLALIRLGDADFDHAWMTLSSPPRTDFGAQLYLVGYSEVYSQSPKMHSRTAAFDEFDWNGELIHISDCEVPAGTSGGPLLDLEHALIRGVVKSSRSPNSEMGGLAVAVAAVRDTFPEHWPECSTEEHEDWTRLQIAIRRFADPTADLLPHRYRERIEAICARCGLTPLDFQKIYEGIRATHESCHPRLPHPARQPCGFEELAREVVGELMAQFTDCLHPLVETLDRLGESVREKVDEAYLRERADLLAADLGGRQPALLDLRRAAVAAASGIREPDGLVICIRLLASKERPDKCRLDAWTSRSRSGRPTRVAVPKRALTMEELERKTREIVNSELKRLPGGDVTIEFAVPRRLLNEPLETWHLGDPAYTLGVLYAVVVRCTERANWSDHSWRTRGRDLRAHPAAGPGSAPAVEWLSCKTVQTGGWFSGYFSGKSKKQLTTVALCNAPSAESRVMLDSCLDVGIPVIVWHRESCAEHSHTHQQPTGDADSPACSGARFEAWMKPLMTGVEVAELPEFVRDLRADAASHSMPQARGIVLLWDDPARVPWLDELPLQVPAPGKGVA